jgi:hypothetical protein
MSQQIRSWPRQAVEIDQALRLAGIAQSLSIALGTCVLPESFGPISMRRGSQTAPSETAAPTNEGSQEPHRSGWTLLPLSDCGTHAVGLHAGRATGVTGVGVGE